MRESPDLTLGRGVARGLAALLVCCSLSLPGGPAQADEQAPQTDAARRAQVQIDLGAKLFRQER